MSWYFARMKYATVLKTKIWHLFSLIWHLIKLDYSETKHREIIKNCLCVFVQRANQRMTTMIIITQRMMKRKCWFENITGEKLQLAFMWKQVQHITSSLSQWAHKKGNNKWFKETKKNEWLTKFSSNDEMTHMAEQNFLSASRLLLMSRSAFHVNKRKIKTDNEKAHKQQTENSWSLGVGAAIWSIRNPPYNILEEFVSLIGFGAYNNHLGDNSVIDMTTTDMNKTNNKKWQTWYIFLLVGIGFRFLVY